MTSSTAELLNSLTPFSQGAEAKVYQCYLHGNDHPPILLKHRFPKQYRHPTLDNSLTKARVSGEARILLKCLRSGVRVPGVRMVDVECGVLGLEWIEGRSVRNILGGGDEGIYEEENQDEEAPDIMDEKSGSDVLGFSSLGITIDEAMKQIGVEIAKMHLADIIHGDLTTSNMMIRPIPSSEPSSEDSVRAELVLIDFGLSFVSNLIEDKAVDLFVLERAFASTHPDSEHWFDAVLGAYAKRSGNSWDAIHKRLQQVRLRGRKRSMVG
ncbi:kinase-like domain-containing protein [Hysterangium stoloniferum]|nr:kinase-like domain-containing protein [Hysterangium stoloniferum]